MTSIWPTPRKRFSAGNLSAAMIVILLGYSCTVLAGDGENLDELQLKLTDHWQLIKNDRIHNIRSYAKLESGKRFRSFRVEAFINASPESLTRCFLDFSNYSRWYWSVRESRLLKQVSPTEYYLLMVHNAPYAMPDRDVVLHAVVEPPTAESPAVVLRVHSEPDYIPPNPPLIRMPAEDILVRFKPLPGNRLELVAEGYADPGGNVPSWAANFVQRSAPYGIILNLQRLLEKETVISGTDPLPFPVYPYAEPH